MTEDELVGRHHWLNGHESEQAPGGGEGQGSLECCSPWGRRVGHDLATEKQQPHLVNTSCVLVSIDDTNISMRRQILL